MVKNILSADAALQANFLVGRACALYGAVVLRDLPVADVMDTGSDKVKSRFDFVVFAHGGTPLFAMDIGAKPRGKAKERSKAKRRLCRSGNFPLFTVRSAYLDSEHTRQVILAWCIELWFTRGRDGQREIFPDSFFEDIDGELDKLKSLAGYRSFRLTLTLGENRGQLRGLAAIIINNGFGWLSKGRVSSTFPAGFEEEMLKVIVVKDVYSKYIEKMADSKYKTKKRIKKEFKAFRKKYDERGSGSFGWGR